MVSNHRLGPVLRREGGVVAMQSKYSCVGVIRLLLLGIVVALPWCLGSGPALGAEIEGVTFASASEIGAAKLPLRGVGLAKYLRFINVYVAALYLDPGVTPEHVLDDVPKRLELSYLRSLKAGDFAEAANKVLPDNVPQGTVARLRAQIDQLHRLYQDINPGDRYTLTYLPGVGTELAHNGKSRGIIPGADFAAAYFAIWLGPDPISQALKDGLLGLLK